MKLITAPVIQTDVYERAKLWARFIYHNMNPVSSHPKSGLTNHS